MPQALSTTEVVALTGLEERRVRKDVEYGVVEAKSPPRFELPDVVYFRALAELGIELDTFQSNTEGALIDYIQGVAPRVDAFLVNAGGLTHTSVSLRDALIGVGRPFVEVHLTNPASRESFRHGSLLSDRALGVVVGFGADSYLLGLRGLVARLGAPARGS